MVLFVAFYAGVITLFRGAVTRWQQPELRVQTTVSPAEYQSWLDRFLALHPQARDEFWMILPGEQAPQLRFMGWKRVSVVGRWSRNQNCNPGRMKNKSE